MSFRIMRLSREPKGFKIVVEQGITFPGGYIDRINSSYGIITSSVSLKEPLNVNLCYEYYVEDLKDGYKDVIIHPARL